MARDGDISTKRFPKEPRKCGAMELLSKLLPSFVNMAIMFSPALFKIHFAQVLDGLPFSHDEYRREVEMCVYYGIIRYTRPIVATVCGANWICIAIDGLPLWANMLGGVSMLALVYIVFHKVGSLKPQDFVDPPSSEARFRRLIVDLLAWICWIHVIAGIVLAYTTQPH